MLRDVPVALQLSRQPVKLHLQLLLRLRCAVQLGLNLL